MDTSKIVQENPSLRLSKKYVKKEKKKKKLNIYSTPKKCISKRK